MVENQRLTEAVRDLKENLNEERDENTKLSRENEKFEREVKDLRRNNNLLKGDVSYVLTNSMTLCFYLLHTM